MKFLHNEFEAPLGQHKLTTMLKEMTAGRIGLALPGLADLLAERALAHANWKTSKTVGDGEVPPLRRSWGGFDAGGHAALLASAAMSARPSANRSVRSLCGMT